MKPKRIQSSRLKGWRKPEAAVYVGRPSKWGNPFVVCDFSGTWMVGKEDPSGIFGLPKVFTGNFATEADATKEACRCYRATLSGALAELARRTLRGKDLACWCPVDQPCHADVLLEIANDPAWNCRAETPDA